MREVSIIDQQQSLNMPASTSSNSPESNGGESGGEILGDNVEENESTTSEAASAAVQPADSFPSKTDKPKPHGCVSCGRHFARLEHLKRHERIHTKEKPFACSECGRAFSRRDLQIRHQQKLHSETTPPAKPRDRRTSVASSAGGAGGPHRVQKNSSARSGSMRPRANTLSHVEGAFMQLTMDQMASESLAAESQNRSLHLNHVHSRHPSLAELPMNRDYEFGGVSGIGGMSAAMDHRGMHHGLPKIDTSTSSRTGYLGGLRTAPVPGGFQPADFEFDHNFRNFGFPPGNGSTINPSALHLDDSPLSMAIDSEAFNSHFPDPSAIPMLDDNFAWDPTFNQMNFDAANENAIDGSSPSAISTASYSGISDGIMLDGSNNTAPNTASMWHQPMMGNPLMTPNFVDHGNQHLANFASGNQMSPHILPHNHANSPYFPTPSSLGPSVMPGLNDGLNHTQAFHPPMTLGPETPNSIPGGVHGILPLSTITDSTRSALVTALAQDTSFGGRKFSIPSVNSPSPLSPRFPVRANSVGEITKFLPSTFDLQRYIGAYIKYFHPHLPFLHIPTLSFDLRTYANDGRGAATSIDGPGCLALSMAAIGALYEREHPQAKALFESAKKMLQLYIEERRKADVRRADHRKTSVDHSSRAPQAPVHTPVWLAQAMLLNIIYGFNCGDKVAGDNSLIHCATLVSLAKAADLMRPPPSHNGLPQHEVQMTTGDHVMNGNIKSEIPDDQQEWLNWKVAEERKRTLYAIFILSSMLVSAYNHAPALTNSEIESDLPCDEEFWAAENANSFYAIGGSASADRKKTTFKAALSELLQASNRPQYQQGPNKSFGNGHNAQDLAQNLLEPSAFGCLILINALHNYIWETRQRHTNKAWTNEDTEKMHHHIEPALKAWQSAWQRNPKHCVNRPNPNGVGPLSADSVPLLDLAYIRLFVNMSKSKEKFWQRDFDGMASELSRGNGIVPNEEQSPSSSADSMEFSSGSAASSVAFPYSSPPMSSAALLKRERRLRRAANYAADSLTMSDQFGITFADFTSRELPLQSAMCAFDCAQVIAEWVTSLQERVGCHLGILGKNDIDISQVPDIMLVEVEDMRLLHKIQDILDSAERKMNGLRGLPPIDNCGYGTKILRVTAYMLNRAAVWPVTRIMAHALETQAVHMQTRTESSVIFFFFFERKASPGYLKDKKGLGYACTTKAISLILPSSSFCKKKKKKKKKKPAARPCHILLP
ncbi:hypothetical protein EYC80_009011 [Monilinia laxa]|uniref:C2H2-type domain-containing protein n=1 Tax=Monilinia laxa TaxID=61186 RepID=A0A5N6K244_MONLA|nr:hypothetical protein EYC80_009011 [Monilinia laxa]